MLMTKPQFRERWALPEGGGISNGDIADCAVAWGVCSQPRTKPIAEVLYEVLVAAGCPDAGEYNPAGPGVSAPILLTDEELIELNDRLWRKHGIGNYAAKICSEIQDIINARE